MLFCTEFRMIDLGYSYCFFYYECAIHEVVPKVVAIAVNIVMAKWMFFARVLFS